MSTAKRPVPSEVRPGPSKRPREGLKVFRPLVLSGLAALAFAVLLRWHHTRFEDSLIHRFQGYQLTTAQSLASAVQEGFDETVRSLAAMATYADIVQATPAANDILESFRRRGSEVLDGVARLDSQGRVIFQSPPGAGLDAESIPADALRWDQPGAGPSVRPYRDDVLLVTVPLRRGESQAGAILAAVNVRRLAIKGLTLSPNLRTTRRWVVTPKGGVIGQGLSPGASPPVVRHVQLDPLAPGYAVPPLGLLRHVADTAAGRQPWLAMGTAPDGSEELIALVPFSLGGQKHCLVLGSPKSDISVPISSHERVTYTLIAALALLYFATGYLVYRGETARLRYERDARRAAEEASRAKGDFLARMSHELRTPMNGVLGMAELALTATSEADRRRCLATVKDSAEALLTIINDILDFSKIEAHKMDMLAAPFALEECLQSTLVPLEVLAGKKGLVLDWAVEDSVPRDLVGDPGRLRQILTNLVGNAVKFTEKGGVSVHVSRVEETGPGARLEFRIRDTGMGIAPDQQKGLFEAFQQAGGLSAQHTGTGLGLAISKRLTELMGGRIWFQSAPGQGATFSFTVRFALPPASVTGPASEAGGPLSAAPAGSLPSRGVEGARVLVVCGDATRRDSLCSVLARWGACLATARNAEEAVAAAESRTESTPFHLILLDIELEDASGFRLAQTLRADKRFDAAGMAVISPAGLRGDAARCQAAGINGYLSLPYTERQLRELLDLVLARRARRAGAGVSTRYNLGAVAPRAIASVLAPPEPTNLAILLVEDNPVNQEVACGFLRQWGHSVDVAPSGPDALRRLEDRRYDLVFMDVQMPGMDGLQATAEIRKLEADRPGSRRIPIVAMTAHARDSDRQMCLQAGMDDYLSKPVRPEALREVLRRVPAGARAQTGDPAAGARNDATKQAARPTQEPDGRKTTLDEGQTDSLQAPALPMWDEPDALACAGGDPDRLHRLIRIFLEDLTQSLPAAAASAKAARWGEMKAYAHRIKGGLGVLAAKRAQSLAGRLEALCVQETRPGPAPAGAPVGAGLTAAGTWRQLERELDVLRGQLAKALERSPHAIPGSR